jgi:hypothetical protein
LCGQRARWGAGEGGGGGRLHAALVPAGRDTKVLPSTSSNESPTHGLHGIL